MVTEKGLFKDFWEVLKGYGPKYKGKWTVDYDSVENHDELRKDFTLGRVSKERPYVGTESISNLVKTYESAAFLGPLGDKKNDEGEEIIRKRRNKLRNKMKKALNNRELRPDAILEKPDDRTYIFELKPRWNYELPLQLYIYKYLYSKDNPNKMVKAIAVVPDGSSCYFNLAFQAFVSRTFTEEKKELEGPLGKLVDGCYFIDCKNKSRRRWMLNEGWEECNEVTAY